MSRDHVADEDRKYHRWTEQDFATAEQLYRDGHTSEHIATVIGSTPLCIQQRLNSSGVNRGTDMCTVCHGPNHQPAVGRKRRVCSSACRNLLSAAYATNARIDGRVITHCEGCGSSLIPPWTRRRKWCSKACGHRGWYESVATNAVKKERHYQILRRAAARREALDTFTVAEYDQLHRLRVEGAISKRWVRKLCDRLDIANGDALLRYARSVQVFQ